MFKKIILKNGLRLILAPQLQSETATALVIFGTGSKYEEKNENGISHFLEHMFFKGTQRKPSALAVAEILDRVGGVYNAFTAKEYTGFWAKTASENLPLALDWLSDILLHSRFEASEIEKERGVILQEINMVLDMPMGYVEDLWEKLLYGDQPAGWEILGERENIKKISRNDFLKYFKSQYRAKNAVICLAGKLEEDLEKKILEKFGALKKDEAREKLPVREVQTKPETLCYFKETDQTHLCLGARAYDLFHPDYWTLKVLAKLLGGMMSSRLFISVREKKGLAYYVRASAEGYTDSGYLVTQAGVDNSKAGETIRTILKEYQKVKQKRVGPAELKKAKENLKGLTLLSIEGSDGLASWLALQEILKKEILTPKEIFGKIEAVKAEDLARVANDIFQPKNLNLALIGPFKEKEKFEKLLKI